MSETEASFQLENILAELFSFVRRFIFLIGSGLMLGLVSGTALFYILPTIYYGSVEVRMAGYSPILNMEEMITIQSSQQLLNGLSNGNSYPKTVVEACGMVDDPNRDKIANAIARQAKILSPDALRIQIDLTERDRIEPCLAAVVNMLTDWQSTLMERRIGSLRDKIAQVAADIDNERTGGSVPSVAVRGGAALAAERLVPIQVLLAASAHPLVWPTEVVQPVTVWQQSVVSVIVKLIFGGAMIGFCAALLVAILWSRLTLNKTI